MKLQTKLMLAVAALAPVYSSALADPLPVSVNPRSIPRSPDVPRSVLVPAPATGPCRAELGLNRVHCRRATRT